MSELAVTVVVIDQGRILFIQREDLKIWALPGGAVDPGESVAQAAIREVREETGLEVELTRLVGIYARPQWVGSTHSAIFAARPTGGTLRPQPEEVLALQYALPGQLPEPLLWWHRQPILDAVQGIGTAARSMATSGDGNHKRAISYLKWETKVVERRETEQKWV